MKTYKEVDQLILDWAAAGKSKSETAVLIAEACLGWPYVFGARGAVCTPSNRKSRARADHPTIVSKCQVLNGKRDTCKGCTWGSGCRMYDCRGFTYWVLLQVGIKIMGAGATSQYNDASNWDARGKIADMPVDRVCCVFKDNNGTKEHTGLYVGGGQIIHCSGTVKTGKITDKGWTHYAIPKDLDGSVMPDRKPTLRRGDKGQYVVEMQTLLAGLGYDLGPCGNDGDFGKATKAAVERFQSDRGLTVDGICGPATWAALQNAPAPQPEPEPTPEPGDKLYAVTIPHLDLTQATRLCAAYPAATMAEEGGE